MHRHLGALEVIELLANSSLVTWCETRPGFVGASVVLLHFRQLHIIVEANDLALTQLLYGRPEAQLKVT